MAFKLRPLHDVFGIHKDSEFGKPIILKDDLEKGIEGEANRDGTIFVNSKLSDKKVKEAVDHEKVHLDQMAQGRLQYDNQTVTWKKDTKSPAKVYNRETMNEGHPDFEWEDEAYKNSSPLKKDACYKKVVARYGPKNSAYRSGAMAKCRKVGAANWGNSKK
jgi:hypothetical protein